MRRAISIIAAVCLVLPAAALAGRPGTLLLRLDGIDGSFPEGALLLDGSGTLYGTANAGGAQGLGTAFKILPPGPGQSKWRRSTLHQFTVSSGAPREGAYPSGNLIEDAKGDLFGTGFYGGKYNAGVVFELVPPPAGQSNWTEIVLENASAYPDGGVIMDAAGSLYGVQEGSEGQGGFVFRMTPPAVGHTRWFEQKLHIFTGGPDGASPSGGLTEDAAGNLYGVTLGGGTQGEGIVYQLSPPPAGQTGWTETILHVFAGLPNDGSVPTARLAIDAAGVLYGTTQQGGTRNNAGIAFSLAPPTSAGTPWAYNVLFDFTGQNGNGTFAGLAIGNNGALLGTASEGGKYGSGLVYQLTPASAQVTYNETDLYDFSGGGDGGSPYSTPITDSAGNLYGTAAQGGRDCASAGGCGTVFELYPR